MTTSRFILGLFIPALVASFFSQPPALSAEAVSKPNIVFILADDAGVGDYGCYGNKSVPSPNVDKLAAQGMKFTNAYSGSAVCAPCRNVLMTGEHTGHCIRRANQSKHGLLPLPANAVTVAALLKKAGYATGGFGKWGLGNEGTSGAAEKMGFDLFYGYYDQVHAHSYFPSYLVRNSKHEPLPGNDGGKKGQYSFDLILAETLKFLEASKDKPFFCYVPWTIPHGDIEVPSIAQEFRSKGWSVQMQIAATMLKNFDDGVGAVMKKLADLGLDENTLVFFSSDNGAAHPGVKEWNSTAGLRGVKRSLYEGGIRAPLIARWPGKIKPGTTSDLLTSHVDFLASTADLVGTTAPKNDGISILPTLLGTGLKQTRGPLYWEIYEGPCQQAIRDGDWKAYRRGTKDPLELYDLKSDPAEAKDVASANPEIVKRMEEIFAREHTPSEHYDTPEHAKPPAKKKGKN